MEKIVPQKISLVVTIVNRGCGNEINQVLSNQNVFFRMVLLAHGTADSDLLDYLGLGETEKDVVLCTVESSRVPALLQELKREMSLEEIGKGIAFSIPISSVGGPVTYRFLQGEREGETA